VGAKKREKKTHYRGQSLELGFIPSKTFGMGFLDGALVGVVSQKPYVRLE